MGFLKRERLDALRHRLVSSKFVRDTAALQAGKLVTIGLASLSYVLTLRLLGPDEYGVYGLALGLIALLFTFDLTGMGTAAPTRLGIAIGGRDAAEVLNIMAVFIRTSMIVNALIIAFLWLLGGALAGALYSAGARIGALAALLALALPADSIYALITTSLQARRQMPALALVQTGNQLTFTICVLVALLIRPQAESLVAARLVYSYLTMLLAWAAYARLRAQTEMAFPPLAQVFARARVVAVRPYLGFGVVVAVDKSLGNLLVQLPQQMVGILAGERAAGFLISTLNGISHLSVLTSALFDNMQAVIPHRIGQRDYAGLWRILGRVLAVLLIGGVLVYGALALAAPFFIPLLLGARWQEMIPVFVVLTIFGVITTVGGVFGPLYRGLNRLRGAILSKLLALGLALAFGFLMLMSAGSDLPGQGTPDMMLRAALVGAWMVNLTFGVSVLLTAWVSLRALRQAKDVDSR